MLFPHVTGKALFLIKSRRGASKTETFLVELIEVLGDIEWCPLTGDGEETVLSVPLVISCPDHVPRVHILLPKAEITKIVLLHLYRGMPFVDALDKYLLLHFPLSYKQLPQFTTLSGVLYTHS